MSSAPSQHQQSNASVSYAQVEQMVAGSMRQITEKEPYQWQISNMAHWLAMAIPSLPDHPPAPVLQIRPTGGGKSSTRDVSGVMLRGVTLTIVPLLALGADQEQKLSYLSAVRKLNNVNLRMSAHHLDEIRYTKVGRDLFDFLRLLPSNTESTFFLFSSPQLITTDRAWRDLFQELCKRGVLRFVCIDEVHLLSADLGLTIVRRWIP